MANYDYRYDDDYDPYEYEDIDDFDEEDFMIGYKDELLSKEDFKEMWLAICELFPEYDFLSYIKEFEDSYASCSLNKFNNPSKVTLKREQKGIEEFFNKLGRYTNIGDLNDEIVTALIKKGRYMYEYFPVDEEVGDFYGDWEGEIYIPKKVVKPVEKTTKKLLIK